jgi:L-amino acid N-acyltransferase YncA
MYKLNNNDYKQILEYYNQPIPKSSKLLKKNAENLLSEKLCKCIKKIEPKNESRSIGICTKSIFKKKGLTRGKFKCKGKSKVIFNKTKKNIFL